MTTKEKTSIKEKLAAYCEQKGSRNRAAKSLNEVSPATISQILSGNWDMISDDMWRNVGAQVGYDRRQWAVFPTRGYSKMFRVLGDAQDNSLVMAVIGDAGCGKTEAVRRYTSENRNVYHLCCSEYWNRKLFMAELLQSIGIDNGGTVGEMMADAVQALKKMDRPLIILDEADKISDQVLYFFISMYNKLEDQCGIILTATDYLEKRIRRGVRNSRKGYKEIFSRIGRKFVSLPLANSSDIMQICIANGITDKADIACIVEDSDSDLRRVKRLVFAKKLDEE